MVGDLSRAVSRRMPASIQVSYFLPIMCLLVSVHSSNIKISHSIPRPLCSSVYFCCLPIHAGNSGGPLLDSSGRLIGVNTAIFAPGAAAGIAGNIGIGFAIPVDTVRRVVNQLIRYGRVVRPTIGINVSDDRVTRSIGAQLRRRLDGVLVAEVLPGSPAEEAGMRATSIQGDGSVVLGDLIAEVDGEPVKQVEDLLSAIEERREGDVVSLSLYRGCDPARPEILQVRLTSRDRFRRTDGEPTNLRNNYRRSGRLSPMFGGGQAWQ